MSARLSPQPTRQCGEQRGVAGIWWRATRQRLARHKARIPPLLPPSHSPPPHSVCPPPVVPLTR